MRARSTSIALLALPIASWALALGCADEPAGAPDAAVTTSPDAAAQPDAQAMDAAPEADAGAGDAGDPRPVVPSWRALGGPPVTAVRGRWGAPAAYVPSERRFIIYGGSQYPVGATTDGTWSYSVDDDLWTQITTNIGPSPRYCYGLLYLPDQHQVLLVGGRNGDGPVGGAWLLDLATSTWEELGPTLPPGIIGPSAVWMPDFPGGGRAVIFGGSSRSGLPRQTYTYDPEARTFEQVQTTVSPPGRQDATMIYDPGDGVSGGRVLLFGGAYAIIPVPHQYADLWSFDGLDWVRTASAAGAVWPPARRSMGGAFDPVHREWIMFSGTYDTEDAADLWLYDARLGEWRSLSMEGAPLARGFPSFGLAEEEIFLFGGLSQPNFRAMDDGWALRLRE